MSKTSPQARKFISRIINQQRKKGKPLKQAIAIAYSMARARGFKVGRKSLKGTKSIRLSMPRRRKRKARKSRPKTLKRRRTIKLSMPRKKRRRTRKGTFGFGGSRTFSDMAKGAAIATIVEPFADQFIASFAPSIPRVGNIQPDDMVKVGIGYFLGKKKGLLGSTARFIGLFGVRNIVKQLTAGGFGIFAPRQPATTPTPTQTPVQVSVPGAQFR
jgi:hypothetical protein